MSEKFWFLKKCPLFERLTVEQAERLESRSRVRSFARGTPIYLPADEVDGVLLLASGRVKICGFTAEGKQSILAFIEPGEVFGELALLGAEHREDYAETCEKSVVLLLPCDEVSRLMEEHANVSLGVTKLIGLRRQRIERRLKYLLFHSNLDRLVHLLLELAETYGRQQDDELLLDIKLSHQDLANIIGSTRETVTVLLGDLQDRGLIRTGRRKVVIRRIDQLAASVGVPEPPLERRDQRQPSVAKLPTPPVTKIPLSD